MERLPPNLLHMILSFTVNETSNKLEETIPLDCHSILKRLSLVCKEWKRVCKSIKVKYIVLETLKKELVPSMCKRILELYPKTENLELIFYHPIPCRRATELERKWLKKLWEPITKLDESVNYEVINFLSQYGEITETHIHIIAQDPNHPLERRDTTKLREDLRKYMKLYKHKYDVTQLELNDFLDDF